MPLISLPALTLLADRVRFVGQCTMSSAACLALNPAQGLVYQEAHCASLYICVVCVLDSHLPLVCFRLADTRLPCGMILTRLGLCTLDIAAPRLCQGVRFFTIHQFVVSAHMCH